MRVVRHLLAPVLICVAVRAFTLGSASGHPDSRDAAAAPGTEYVTLNPGEVIDLSPGPVYFGDHPILLRPTGNKWLYRAASSGHTKVRVGAGVHAHTFVIFVAPTPSRQVGRADLEWYRTQFGRGFSDCGPALVSMSILWARGVDVPVRKIRSEIGYPLANGATSFDDLRAAMRRHEIASLAARVQQLADLVAILERGHLALVLIRTGGIGRVVGDPREDLVGRYYDYQGGHFVLVKGYSLDHAYFVVFDPYPADWSSNGLRYEDGETMIGKNRYYPAGEVLAALKTHEVLEVSRRDEEP